MARSSVGSIAYSLLLCILLAACSTPPKYGYPTDPSKYHHALVKTGDFAGEDRDAGNDTARLRAYLEALKKAVGDKDLSGAFIGCAECLLLDDGRAPRELNFYFYHEHRYNIQALSKAFARVQAMPFRNLGFTLTFDNGPLPAGACPSPRPAQCVPAIYCPVTSYCDGDAGAPYCQKCTP